MGGKSQAETAAEEEATDGSGDAEILKQALAARDVRLIANAIDSKDALVVREKVRALKAKHARELFSILCSFVAERPSSAFDYPKHLLWLRELMLCHSTNIIAEAASLRRLDFLQRHCAERVLHEGELIRLQGLLDSISFRMEKSSQMNRTAAMIAEDARDPLTIHVENAPTDVSLQEVLREARRTASTATDGKGGSGGKRAARPAADEDTSDDGEPGAGDRNRKQVKLDAAALAAFADRAAATEDPRAAELGFALPVGSASGGSSVDLLDAVAPLGDVGDYDVAAADEDGDDEL